MKGLEQQTFCYMCDQPSTSKEHVPPRCFFPKGNNEKNEQRTNLITVPSCDLHNSAKSKDDEYVRQFFAASLTSNPVGHEQFLDKGIATLKRSPALASRMTSGARGVVLHNTETNRWERSVALKVETNRVLNWLDTASRAIYFHEKNCRFSGAITIVENFLLDPKNSDLLALKESFFSLANDLFQNQTPQGENPGVFTFRISHTDDLSVLELTFYSGTKAIAVLKHDTLRSLGASLAQ
jgi:hypothetical protein